MRDEGMKTRHKHNPNKRINTKKDETSTQLHTNGIVQTPKNAIHTHSANAYVLCTSRIQVNKQSINGNVEKSERRYSLKAEHNFPFDLALCTIHTHTHRQRERGRAQLTYMNSLCMCVLD